MSAGGIYFATGRSLILMVENLVGQFRIHFLDAVGADAMAEGRLGMGANIVLDLAPGACIVTDLAAMGTYGKDAA